MSKRGHPIFLYGSAPITGIIRRYQEACVSLVTLEGDFINENVKLVCIWCRVSFGLHLLGISPNTMVPFVLPELFAAGLPACGSHAMGLLRCIYKKLGVTNL